MIPNSTALAAIKAKITAAPYVGMSPTQMVSQINLQQSQTPQVFADNPIEKATFTQLLAPALLTLAGLSQAIQAKWQPIISYLLGSPDQPVLLSIVGPMLASSVADGLMTQAQITAIQEVGTVEITQSDAQVIGFASLDIDDINAALGS